MMMMIEKSIDNNPNLTKKEQRGTQKCCQLFNCHGNSSDVDVC